LLVRAGDLNGDGTSDVLLLHTPTNTVSEWLMQNGRRRHSAALPLFASGLGVMGLFGWRRKRKAQAAA
jgi:hypothetical protein